MKSSSLLYHFELEKICVVGPGRIEIYARYVVKDCSIPSSYGYKSPAASSVFLQIFHINRVDQITKCNFSSSSIVWGVIEKENEEGKENNSRMQ
jgi:hypothetical protein